MPTSFPRLNAETLSQFWQIAYPFFRSPARKRAWGLLITLLVLLLLVSAVNVLMSYVGRDLMTALSERQQDLFLKNIYYYMATFLLAIPIAVYYRYTEERLALIWRQWMTEHLIKRYLLHRSYYNLRSRPEIDNPDQRIAEDVRNFTATTLSFFLIILNSTITLFAFIGVLYSISLTLVAVLFLYAVGGTILTFLIGRRLVRLHYRQYKREATLRYSLIRLRENAESVAFFRGEPRERQDLIKKLLGALNNTRLIIGWNRNLSFFTTSYNYFALLVPTIIVAPLYLRGQVPFGTITQAGAAFAQVLAAISLLITQFERLSAFTAGVSRLHSLWQALSAADPSEQDDDPQIESIEKGKELVLKNVTVRTPDGQRELIRDLSLAVEHGSSVIVMGESGSGKSSLLRTIGGLWTRGDGRIQRPKLAQMMFLPQRPYMVSGTLRAQLMYPFQEKATKANDRKLIEIMKKVNLENVLERVSNSLDRQLDWPNVLSLGEQQRISFARLLLNSPLVSFLDEATSALDEDNEALLYRLLMDAKCTYVSVGHRSTLCAFHDTLLKLEKDGSWEISAV